MTNSNKNIFIITVFAAAVVLSPLALASFDGDSYPDLFIPTDDLYHPTVHWYENEGAGGVVWKKLIENYNGEQYYSAAKGDLDGDKFPDLLIGSSEYLYWFEAYNDDLPTQINRYSLDFKCNDIFIDDTSGTAYITCGQTIADPNGGVFYSLKADGDNNAALTTIETNPNYAYRTVMTCDFDADGKQELFLGVEAVDDPTYGHIHLYEVGPVDGSINWIRAQVTGKPGGDAFVAGDFDGDANMDVFLSRGAAYGGYEWGGYVDWFEADGSDNGLTYLGEIVQRRAASMVLTDYDGDGQSDLIVSAYPDKNGSGANTHWYEAAGDNAYDWIGQIQRYHYGYCLAAGDWDGDGYNDILWGCREDAGNEKGLHHLESNGDDTTGWQGAIAGSLYDGKDGVLIEAPGQCGDLGTDYLAADFNNDCYVNQSDLLIFAQQWLSVK